MVEPSPRRGPGRPPTHRGRRPFHPYAEPALLDALDRYADVAGMPRGTFAEAVVAAAHDYTSRYYPDVSSFVPVGLEALRAYLADGPQLPDGEAVRGELHRLPVRPERFLAQEIIDRATELGISYSNYLRALLRFAVGLDPRGAEAPEQLQLSVGRAS